VGRLVLSGAEVWGDGEMGSWGGGELGSGEMSFSPLPLRLFCPMPNAQCPMPHAQSKVTTPIHLEDNLNKLRS